MKHFKSKEAEAKLAENPEMISFLDDSKEKSFSLKKLRDDIRKPSLVVTIFQLILMRYFSASFFKFFREMTMMFGPFVLEYASHFLEITDCLGKFLFVCSHFRLIINFVKNRNESVFIGLFYTYALLVCFLVQCIFFQQYLDRTFSMGGRLRTAVMNSIYKKVTQSC